VQSWLGCSLNLGSPAALPQNPCDALHLRASRAFVLPEEQQSGLLLLVFELLVDSWRANNSWSAESCIESPRFFPFLKSFKNLRGQLI